jgi:hypothetical protein
MRVRKNKLKEWIMGADLYIEKMDRDSQCRGFEVSAKAREAGYFRDCYNGGGLFAVMSANLGEKFSWWKLSGELPLKDGLLPVDEVRKLLKRLKPHVKRFCKLKKMKYGYDDSKGIAPDDIKHYREWANGLIEFLELAVKKKSGIIFSV